MYEYQLCCLTQWFNPSYHALISSLLIPSLMITLSALRLASTMLWWVKPQVSLLPRWPELIQFELLPLWRIAFILPSRRKLSLSHFTLYSTLLTSPWTGAVLTGVVLTAIELTSSSPTSANTDEVAFLEGASALLCASVFINAEIAWNHYTKLLIGVISAPTALLVSPPVASWVCQCSSASLQVSGGMSFEVKLAGNSFSVNFHFEVGFKVVFGLVN